jgi:hypothetical protein
MTPRRLAIFAGTALLGLSVSTQSQEQIRPGAALEEHRESAGVLWSARPEGGPLYLPPEEIFAPDSQLRPDWLTPRALSLLAEKLERARSLERTQPNAPCLAYVPQFGDLPPSIGQDGSRHALSVPDAARQVILSARIVKVAPGFRLSTLSPTNLITMQPERIFRDRSSLSLTPSTVLKYETLGGAIQVGAAALCVTSPGEFIPRVGNRVLVAGAIDPRLPAIIYPNEPQGILLIRADDMVVIPSRTPDGAPDFLPLTSVPQHLDLLTADQRSDGRNK